MRTWYILNTFKLIISLCISQGKQPSMTMKVCSEMKWLNSKAKWLEKHEIRYESKAFLIYSAAMMISLHPHPRSLGPSVKIRKSPRVNTHLGGE